MGEEKNAKLWGGRFSGGLDPAAWALNASLAVDRRLADQDVRGSQAWAQALQRAGVLTGEEAGQIWAGLQAIREEFRREEFAYQPSDEDIHTAVERRLGELIGPLAGKLHTGRSRNDQVATDFRLWMLEALPVLDRAVCGLQQALVQRAETDLGLLLPGYTHLQRAQPVLLSHWWLSHFWPLQRDRERLSDLTGRVSVLPLGCSALAGTPYPVDRDGLAAELGFAFPAANSLDAVSDRDFAAEFLFCCSLLGVHLSRLAEAIVLFTSAEFAFFELADAYATGSSLMPQKKNPDVFELARGKAATLTGLLVGMLGLLKGLPSTYDKDLQEDKPPVFAAFDLLTGLLPVLGGALTSLAVRADRMRQAIDPGLMATDLADYLVSTGIPFREAHHLVGKAVQLAGQLDIPLDQLSLEQFQSLGQSTAGLSAELYTAFQPENSVSRRRAYGGTAPEAVAVQLKEARSCLGLEPGEGG
jgi:argininosuccinate lyase